MGCGDADAIEERDGWAGITNRAGTVRIDLALVWEGFTRFPPKNHHFILPDHVSARSCPTSGHSFCAFQRARPIPWHARRIQGMSFSKASFVFQAGRLTNVYCSTSHSTTTRRLLWPSRPSSTSAPDSPSHSLLLITSCE